MELEKLMAISIGKESDDRVKRDWEVEARKSRLGGKVI